MRVVELSGVHLFLAANFADWQDAVIRSVDDEALTAEIDRTAVKLDHLGQLADLEVGHSLRVSLRWSLVSLYGTDFLVLPFFNPKTWRGTELPEESLEWSAADRAGWLYAGYLRELGIEWNSHSSPPPRSEFTDDAEWYAFEKSAHDTYFGWAGREPEGPLDDSLVGPLILEESDNGWALVTAAELDEFTRRQELAEKLEQCRCLGEIRDIWAEVQRDEFLAEWVLDNFEESDLASDSSTPADMHFQFVIDDCEEFIPRPIWLEMATYDTLSNLPDEPPFSDWEYEVDVAVWIPSELVHPTLEALRTLGHEVEVRGHLPKA